MKNNDFKDLNKKGRLTPQQEAFCQLYVQYSNAGKAYREAYNKPDSVSSNTMYSCASDLMRIPKITMRVTEIQAELAKDFKVDTHWIFQQYSNLYHEAVSSDKPAKQVAMRALEGMNKMISGIKIEDKQDAAQMSLDAINQKIEDIKNQQQEFNPLTDA